MRLSLPTAVLSMASAIAMAADTPGTPNHVTATSQGSDRISVAWAVTSRREELVKFEVEARHGDAPVSVPQPDGTSGTGAGWQREQGYVVRRLEPEQQYCFRVWSRYVDSDVRSAQPSAWACANTTAVPPLAPLDFTATYVPGESHVLLHWNTPDQSGHRPIDFYEIERQSPPGPNRPTLTEGKVLGPRGEQTATTKLNFMFRTSTITLPGNHAFRVCSVNSGGRVCSAQIAAVAENQKNQSERRPTTPAGTPTSPTPTSTAPVATSKALNSLPGSSPSSTVNQACKPNYVQRAATPSDHVCVTPAVRNRVLAENANADQHHEKDKPDVCKAGYVWRETTPNDHVCVTPASRELAQKEK